MEFITTTYPTWRIWRFQRWKWEVTCPPDANHFQSYEWYIAHNRGDAWTKAEAEERANMHVRLLCRRTHERLAKERTRTENRRVVKC